MPPDHQVPDRRETPREVTVGAGLGGSSKTLAKERQPIAQVIAHEGVDGIAGDLGGVVVTSIERPGELHQEKTQEFQLCNDVIALLAEIAGRFETERGRERRDIREYGSLIPSNEERLVGRTESRGLEELRVLVSPPGWRQVSKR